MQGNNREIFYNICKNNIIYIMNNVHSMPFFKDTGAKNSKRLTKMLIFHSELSVVRTNYKNLKFFERIAFLFFSFASFLDAEILNVTCTNWRMNKKINVVF